MRLRNWLLTGTSVAVLALAPVTAANAQSAELVAAVQAYQAAQAAGDAAATEAALASLTELCIVEGYASVEDCVAAVSAAAAPPPAEEAAPVEEAPPAEQAAPAEEAPPTEEAAPAEEAPPVEEPAPVEEASPPAEETAPVEEAAPAEEPPPVEEPAPAEEAAPTVEETPAEEPVPAEEPAPAEEAPAEPAGPTPEELQAQFVADLNAALGQYQDALNQAAAGDYAGAQPKAAEAEARITQLCTDNGYPSVEACIGQTLPPLPEPTAAEEAPAEEAPPAVEAPAEEAPAAEAPAEEAAAEEAPASEAPAEPAPPAEETPAETPAAAGETPAEQPAEEVDPLVQAQADIQTAVELYNVGAQQLEAGDPAGQSTVDAANAQLTDICTSLGFSDVSECVTQFGYTLPPLPETPVEPAAAAETPAEALPGAEEIVTPEAVEVLPEAIAPEEAAPVLDSAKDAAAAPPAEEVSGETAPAETPAEGTAGETAPAAEAAPPPASDIEAQAALAPVEVAPVTELSGEQLAPEELPPPEVPQNVTIVNNITNETNTTTTTTNNYTNTGFILQFGVNLVINNPAQERDRFYDEDEDEVYYERLPRGHVKETIVRPNGVQIVTIRNRYGEVIRRSRVMPDGREYLLAYAGRRDDDDERREWRDPGEDLPPLRLTIPVREYILDAEDADEEEVEEFFREPPVEQVRRIYTIDEVKRSARIRDSVRRLEVGGLTFDTGAATISRSQVGALSKVANAMLALLEDNPAETFLIEGHTDAVGSEVSNLVLSDARAATVARILTDFYDIPPENLVTQGYGERYLKVRTEAAERLNRRVTIKRITPLITLATTD